MCNKIGENWFDDGKMTDCKSLIYFVFVYILYLQYNNVNRP